MSSTVALPVPTARTEPHRPGARGTRLYCRLVTVPLSRPADLFGPLAAVIADPAVTDIFVNGSHGVWADRGDGPERVPVVFAEAELRALAVRLVASGGRHLDEAAPLMDVHVGDGIRVHAVLPPIATAGTTLSVRIPRSRQLRLDDLENDGTLEPEQVRRLRGLVGDRVNLLVTGAAGAGKTTLLGALLAEAPANERLVIIEDVAELRVDHPHVVSLETRQPNLEGAGGIDLVRLVRESLRMRPDRLVLGECRGAEVRELLAALNTGHDGGAGTLHANSLRDVPARLEALGALAGLGPEAVARQAVSAIGAILHLTRSDAGRRLAAVGALTIGRDHRLAVVES